MSNEDDDDYVLGTHEDELRRLVLQHSVWKPTVLDCWQRNGISSGTRILDLGCGPGFATVDLAEVTGPHGRVVAVDRSPRFVEATRQMCASRRLDNVEVHRIDVMTQSLPAAELDAVWTRWVACFISDPELLVRSMAAALRPGGIAIFHEYVDYATWKMSPPSPYVEDFVRRVMKSWRDAGGEPNIARKLPTMLSRQGFRLRETRPHIFCARPNDEVWRWPASFIEINLDRLRELELADASWVSSVRRAMNAAESNEHSLMMTPMVLEIVAQKDA